MLPRYVLVELLKLRRSLAGLLCLVAPACVALLGGLIALDRKTPGPWPMFATANAALWSFAMLPLAVTALSVLMAQMEHGPRTWNHLLTLPGARPWLFLAKALVMMALVAGMMALLFVLVHLVGWGAQVLRPGVLSGRPDPATLAALLARMAAASLLVCMLQLWVALRFRSFVVPLAFGIGGTLVAVGATSARQGVCFPWLLATNMLSTPDRLALALWIGGAGGLAVLAAMLVDLSRREA